MEKERKHIHIKRPHVGKKAKIATAIITVLVIAVCCVSIWRTRSMGEAEYKLTDASVEREDCFLLVADGDTLMAFSSLDGDTLIAGGVASMTKVTRMKTKVSGQWVNRWPVIPSCQGRLMVMPADTASVCHTPSKDIHAIVDRQIAYIDQSLKTIEQQLTGTDYYIRTHDVTELGFDVVARAQEQLISARDSLGRIEKELTEIKGKKNLALGYNANYYVYVKNGKKTQRISCYVDDMRDSTLILRTKNGEKPSDLSTRLNIYTTNQVQKRIKERPAPKLILANDTHIDSLGMYVGEVDSKTAHHGYGRLITHDWGYYEGNWEHGKRSGFGLALTPGKRLRIGEWKDDCYLGERITYTSQRIYGIDLSRYQHESGRKKFRIDWDHLAITSLGTISRKTISGTVNYPISFIYIKSTEGATVFNKYFNMDYKASRQHGYKTGAYHFFSTTSPGTQQALFFLKKTTYHKGDFPPVLDVEPYPSQIKKMGGVSVMFTNIRKWLYTVEKAWGVKPILYISQTFVNKYLPSAPDLMKNYNVWIARYGEYKPDVNLVYWQLCPDGRVRGIKSEVDINVFNGFAPEWKKFCE